MRQETKQSRRLHKTSRQEINKKQEKENSESRQSAHRLNQESGGG